MMVEHIRVAAANGHVDVIRILAGLGAHVNTPMKDGATPVFIAAQNGHIKTIRVLISSIIMRWAQMSVKRRVSPMIMVQHPCILRPKRVMPRLFEC